MQSRIDLNADMGESFGPWTMGDDAALLDVVSSANIACGFHAGDPDVMAGVMRGAVARGVGIGAHPGFADLQGFGRRRMALSLEEVGNLVSYQVGAAAGMARAAGGALRHVKLHGALSNMASTDAALARACLDAALRVDPDLIMVVLPATALEAEARALGCAWAGEIFADRGYEDDGTLVPRGSEGAMIDTAEAAGARILEMLRHGALIARSGRRIPARIDTICVHGDSAEAVGLARGVRGALEAGGVRLERFEGARG
ncbi:LamB/YcsF family protein [Poseidonocella sedimentorum]|uniref:5-oxoprolinase subunit A n=1 Tax=Poseidonocella sedimentorum TaxID=871652 RepID=A0A1I6EFS1_9RHOB|nr:5-oxoprolinase subunit PxpA [Poseidonocella sedimentorum]SFR16606.1 UPF0271 protein [Poseidonocella sedimentorum]